MKTFLIGGKRTVPGFSLMEMLIVVMLFSISMLVIAQTFSSFTRLHRKIADRAVLNQDLRFTLELLVRAIRNHAVSYLGTVEPRDSSLRLLQDDGTEMIVRRSSLGEAACADAADVACLLISLNGGMTWTPLTGKHVHVERFDVYVRPLESPFLATNGAYSSDVQPFVTLNFRLRYLGPGADAQAESVEAQTTVSSRVYQR